MLETILCPNCKEKILNEQISQVGKYFICNCGYDSRFTNEVQVIKNRSQSIISPQSYSEILSQLTYLEVECQKLRSEIYNPETFEKHIEILPQIYKNLKMILVR
jgi:deoxycytidine triphosphate deaminase